MLVYGYLNITTLIGYEVFFPKTLLYPNKVVNFTENKNMLRFYEYTMKPSLVWTCAASDGSVVQPLHPSTVYMYL